MDWLAVAESEAAKAQPTGRRRSSVVSGAAAAGGAVTSRDFAGGESGHGEVALTLADLEKGEKRLPAPSSSMKMGCPKIPQVRARPREMVESSGGSWGERRFARWDSGEEAVCCRVCCLVFGYFGCNLSGSKRGAMGGGDATGNVWALLASMPVFGTGDSGRGFVGTRWWFFVLVCELLAWHFGQGGGDPRGRELLHRHVCRRTRAGNLTFLSRDVNFRLTLALRRHRFFSVWLPSSPGQAFVQEYLPYAFFLLHRCLHFVCQLSISLSGEVG